MKGIGINALAIEFSYLVQALFYSIVGTSLGLVTVYSILMPFIAKHPIDFPFSDGILVAPFESTMLRVLVLFICTLMASYIPSRMIIKKNTLNSILGR
jgi:ABC-type antimicrobial peptide transport system permease subunit